MKSPHENDTYKFPLGTNQILTRRPFLCFFKNQINYLKTLSWSLCGLRAVGSHFGFLLLVCTESTEGKVFFLPEKQCVSSLDQLRDTKGTAVLARLEPTEACPLPSRHPATHCAQPSPSLLMALMPCCPEFRRHPHIDGSQAIFSSLTHNKGIRFQLNQVFCSKCFP